MPLCFFCYFSLRQRKVNLKKLSNVKFFNTPNLLIAQKFFNVSRQREGAAMQFWIIILRLHVKPFPFIKVNVGNWVKFFRRETEKPMSRRIRGNVNLIDAAYRERTQNSFVRPLHCARVPRIIRIFMLIYHNSVILQSVATVAVKFAREKPFNRSERISRIDNYQVIFIFTATNEF